ncbi:hypothetical protein MRX96_000240 [Rhipicephalus microplus]
MRLVHDVLIRVTATTAAHKVTVAGIWLTLLRAGHDANLDSDAKACAYEREFNKLFRIPAKRPKVVGFIEDVVRQYSDHEFWRHFRLARPVAEKLVAEFAVSSMCPSSTHGGVQAKSAETHVLTFIWYAANKTCMRDVASRFDMSESTVYRVLQRVAQFLMTLGPSVIKFPADLENLTSSFEKTSVLPAQDPRKEFIRASDAANYGVGACLVQYGLEGKEHCIAFLSSKINLAHTRWARIEKRCLCSHMSTGEVGRLAVCR